MGILYFLGNVVLSICVSVVANRINPHLDKFVQRQKKKSSHPPQSKSS